MAGLSHARKDVVGFKGNKVDVWLSGEGLALLRAWARDGCSCEELARRADVHPATLRRWKQLYPEIGEALRESRELVDVQVENALLQKALSGDVRAIQFWLKSRRAAVWGDTAAAEQPQKVVIVDDL